MEEDEGAESWMFQVQHVPERPFLRLSRAGSSLVFSETLQALEWFVSRPAFPNDDTVFIDIKKSRAVMQFWFDELRAENWMGDDTDMVDVEMVLVNAEVGLFIYVKINVEYRRAGSPLTRVDLRLLPTLP